MGEQQNQPFQRKLISKALVSLPTVACCWCVSWTNVWD